MIIEAYLIVASVHAFNPPVNLAEEKMYKESSLQSGFARNMVLFLFLLPPIPKLILQWNKHKVLPSGKLT